MKRKIKHYSWVYCFIAVFMLIVGHCFSQVLDARIRSLASNVIVPQARSFPVGHSVAVEITRVDVDVTIIEQAATTVMDISLKNPSNSRQEAELIVPVPEGAVVRGFTFQGAGKEPTAQILMKDEARKTYDAIVAKIRDPALLEFIGYNLVRSSVFPIPPRGTQKVRLNYEHLLSADGDRVDYVLPRSESLEYNVPWNISVTIKSKKPISTVYSPSHRIETKRVDLRSSRDTKSPDACAIIARIAKDAIMEPGPFQLSYLKEQNGITASLFAYPDPTPGSGYFLLLAGLPATLPKASEGPAIKREVTLVLDRSGSMNGEKIKQVREAALQLLAGLEEGEAFNLIVYNESVDLFSKTPVLKTEENVKKAREYLKSINARGGTNIHDALLEALRQKPIEGMLPIILFLTDGLPTVGQTSEVAIRNTAIKANRHNRRIFTLGVGVDVNTPLLDKIASETRATSTYVLPKEDVEVKVAQVFKRLAGPVFADTNLEIADSKGNPIPGRVHDMIPGRLPDLFESDQLVLLGRYVGEEPLTFLLSGNYLGKQRTFKFTFSLNNVTTRNSFVPRLWASRKIAVLIDAVRQMGADKGQDLARTAASSDPKLKELVDEIVSLSTEFGILTEYTAFLAREGTDLSDRERVFNQAFYNFDNRAINVRSGMGAVNQSRNNALQMNQAELNRSNSFFDQNMNRVQITTVQQMNDLTFYRRGNQWIDSRIVTQQKSIKPKKEIKFGSQEFRELADRLARQNRQGAISLKGDIFLVVDGEPVLVKGSGENIN